jgi:hypothetical protein
MPLLNDTPPQRIGVGRQQTGARRNTTASAAAWSTLAR